MKNTILLVLVLFSFAPAFGQKSKIPSIGYFKQAKGSELLAAKELQRYLYLRTGELPALKAITATEALPSPGIIVASRANIISTETGKKAALPALAGDSYILKSFGSNQLLIVGGSEVAALYGAYKFLESTSIGFSLHGDIIPDEQTKAINLTGFNQTYQPAFALRGIQPFHDFAEGPDWWNEDEYEATVTQLPKMGMNFIGFHNYPEKNPFGGWEKAEPLAWIGTKDQMNADGTVKSAYPVMHANTGDSTWAYYAKKTSDYHFGASQLFETDIFGADYMQNSSPWPHSPQENITIFNKVGTLLNHTFALAQKLGVQTCLGTETPLTIPSQVKARLRSQNKDPESDATRQELYEGMFSRIKAAYPLNYYWFWTPEGWTWEGESQEAVERTRKDLLSAVAAAKKVEAPFTLATCGWVLGPSRDRAEFDRLLPKEMPFGVINREIGFTPVESSFRNIQGRPKWEITWVEDDNSLTTPQFWAGRVLKDAKDAYQYGCTGFMGIHWRTRNLATAFLALAKAGWEANTYTQSVPEGKRDYAVNDLYHEWAQSEFGAKASDKMATLFAQLDGGPLYEKGKGDRTANFFRSSEWGAKGPGRIKVNSTPWTEVEKAYAFIAAYENCQPMIAGVGNLERYQYWLNTFYYARSQAQVGCLLGEMEGIAKQIDKEKALPGNQLKLASHLLDKRKEAAAAWTAMGTYLLQTVSTMGELGTVANLEQHSLGSLQSLNKYDSLLTAHLGASVPVLNLSNTYQGASRLVVTTQRTLLLPSEAFTQKIRVLTAYAIQSATIFWRPLGKGAYQSKPLAHVGQNVYNAALSTGEWKSQAIEYYIEVQVKSGKLRYPTNPIINQTVVTW
ncbi:MAG: alpha-glucuronidase family glycosyl hydrolase [Bacteroidota bacterium]